MRNEEVYLPAGERAKGAGCLTYPVCNVVVTSGIVDREASLRCSCELLPEKCDSDEHPTYNKITTRFTKLYTDGCAFYAVLL